MDCSDSANITAAAFPVGSPLVSGNPNEWNVGAGNFYSLNENVVPVPANTSNQMGGKKSKTRKHKKSKRRNIKRKHKKTHKKKKHARKHKKAHKKSHKKRHKKSHKKRHSRKHKKSHKKHVRKHKKHARRHRMKGGGRMPLLMPQSLVNGGRSLQSGLEGVYRGFQGKPQPVSPLPTNDQFDGMNQKVLIHKPINIKDIYQAAGKAAGSI